LEAFSYKTLGN